jgi:hypothetical protein
MDCVFTHETGARHLRAEVLSIRSLTSPSYSIKRGIIQFGPLTPALNSVLLILLAEFRPQMGAGFQ